MRLSILQRCSCVFIVALFISFSVIAQDSLVTVTAEKGDGILSLLRKQGMNPYEAYDDFIAMNIDDLRDSVHLYEGRNYRIPQVQVDSVIVLDSIQEQSTKIKR